MNTLGTNDVFGGWSDKERTQWFVSNTWEIVDEYHKEHPVEYPQMVYDFVNRNVERGFSRDLCLMLAGEMWRVIRCRNDGSCPKCLLQPGDCIGPAIEPGNFQCKTSVLETLLKEGMMFIPPAEINYFSGDVFGDLSDEDKMKVTKGHRVGASYQCFNNAMEIARNHDDVEYWEGLFIEDHEDADPCFFIHHAFNLSSEDGSVIETTPSTKPNLYIGKSFINKKFESSVNPEVDGRFQGFMKHMPTKSGW